MTLGDFRRRTAHLPDDMQVHIQSYEFPPGKHLPVIYIGKWDAYKDLRHVVTGDPNALSNTYAAAVYVEETIRVRRIM